MRVEPIRSEAEIIRIEDTLFNLDTVRGDRMFVMFEVGIHMGMRIGDMLELRVGDIRGKDYYEFDPQKTRTHKNIINYKAKHLRLPVAATLRKMVSEMYKGQDDDAYLLQSHKGGAISRQQAWRDMQEIKRLCGVKQNIGCHTLRKTFGYHVYRRTKDVAALQEWFQHSTQEMTLIYIGIRDDERRALTDSMSVGDRGRLDYVGKRKREQKG